jgi:hypothetical protein
LYWELVRDGAAEEEEEPVADKESSLLPAPLALLSMKDAKLG